MACMTNEKQSPLAQKRCSLPGPGGALNLYSTHQQRRLSERGLMIYKPNKPDIDRIRDFTNANNQRKHSTPNFTLYPAGSSACGATGGLKYAHGTFGSLSQLNRNFHGQSPSSSSSVSAGPSPSAYRRNSSLASFSSYTASPGTSTSEGNAGNNSTNANAGATPFSSSAEMMGSSGTARKVRIRIQKNPGANTEKYVELHSRTLSEDQDVGLDGDEMTENERSLFLRSPLFDSRRFSDTAALYRSGPSTITPAITFSLTPDSGGGGGANDEFQHNPGILRRSSDSGPGIVLSTGDLATLKCLTSSAQEISSTSVESGEKSGRDVSPTNLGNRSRSFDATLSISKRGIGSSWFTRRHLPMACKLPNVPSPTSSSVSASVSVTTATNQPLSQMKTPILTITNEHACQSELIEIPSPPTVTPVSSGGSPNEVTSTVPWDKNGYVLDAALLGSAIENHLKHGNNRKRRATFSTLYQAPPSSIECKVTTRARSASACVIPINPKELVHGSTGGGGGSSGRRESISTDRVIIPNFPLSEKGNRRSSLKSMVRFPWDTSKDPQGGDPEETKSLLWDSPAVEYTNTGSFIRTTVTDFGAECIDEEEDEESRTPESANGTNATTVTTTNSSTTFSSKNRKEFVVKVDVKNCNKESPTGSSSAPNSAGILKKGIRGFELPSVSSKGKAAAGASGSEKGDGSSHSAPASPKPTTKRGSENNMSICSAIRDFIIHSIRS